MSICDRVRHLPWRGLLAVMGCMTGACDTDLDVKYHGLQHVADGNFHVLDMFADEKSAVGLAVDLDRDAFSILPLDGEPCRMDGVDGYATMTSSRGLRIATFHENVDPPRLELIDSRCRSLLSPIENVVDLRSLGEQVLITTADGELHWVDPWLGKSRVISDALTERGSAARIAGDTLVSHTAIWLLEGDTLVLRNLEGQEIRRAGRHVTDIALARSGDAMIYSDDDGLFRLDSKGSKPERLADGGCKLRYERYVQGSQTRDIAMLLSPCDDGRLVAVDSKGKTKVIAESVTSFFVRQFVTEDRSIEGWTFYITKQADTGEKRYFMAPPEGEAIEIGVPISSGSVLQPFELQEGSARFWLLTTADDAPRLGTFDVQQGFETVASHVHRVVSTPAGVAVLHDLEDGRGTLSFVVLGGDLHTLAKDVPPSGLFVGSVEESARETNLVADSFSLSVASLPSVDIVLHEYDGDTGTLSVIAPNADLYELARSVPPWSPRSYITAMRGDQLITPARLVAVLSYLEDYDTESESGTLSLLTPSGKLTIASDVGSHVPSSDPNRPGVLYAGSSGATRAVWFMQQ